MTCDGSRRSLGARHGPKELVFATRNGGKVAELVELVAPLGLQVRSARDFPDLPDVEEDGDTFEANALKKARTIAAVTGLPTVADDSGLVVDALGGAPGIYSSRFSGPDATDAKNNALLLERLAGLPPERRTARFHCALAFVDPAPPPPQGGPPAGETRARSGAVEHVALGTCEGVILPAPRGSGGFGYDPLFWVPELGASFAELDKAVKNRVSHRARAIQALVPVLRAHFARRSRAGGDARAISARDAPCG